MNELIDTRENGNGEINEVNDNNNNSNNDNNGFVIDIDSIVEEVLKDKPDHVMEQGWLTKKRQVREKEMKGKAGRRVKMRKIRYDNEKRLAQITEEEKSWLAGLFDSGVIKVTIERGYKHDKRSGKTYHNIHGHFKYTTITNNLIHESIYKVTGHHYTTKHKNFNGKFFTEYYLKISGRNAVNILKAIEKYSHLRKEEKSFYLKFYERPELGKPDNWDDKELKLMFLGMDIIKSQEKKESPNLELVNSWPKTIADSYLDGYRLVSKYTEIKVIKTESIKLGEIDILLNG